MKDLREAGIQSALAPVAESLNAMRPAIREAAEVEALAMKLAGMAGDRLAPVTREVERRADVFEQAQTVAVHVYGSPRKRALQSVLDDLMAGRFG